ncbi:MAG: valine--tRNA ligase [Desulfobacterales bacterium]|nr:valine--tRNA ligase [Desulfobacterales bacterium]
MSGELLDKSYEPEKVEKKWYEFWENENLFVANDDDDISLRYSIVIPPPNVTGVLHMGHALNVTLQDILCRYQKLLGKNIFWLPGTDHAGIATQNVVEKQLSAKNMTRHDLGREKFIEEVWKWREEYGGTIIRQLKRLGSSCDWTRERFTMDEGLSKAVKKVFVRLYNEGLIYKGNYIINWCPRCNTALADIEVDHEEVQGNLYYIRYPFENKKEGLIVATTRPETMLGDTAVAVNPDDPRYAGLKDNKVLLPLVNKFIPIIKDKYVDIEFGTGALKVTPAHDPNDFEIGVRHNLPLVKVIGDNGLMTEEAGRFSGMDRFKCRESVVKALKDEGLIEKIVPNPHNIGHCYRCKTIIEPNLSKQWFVNVKPLAEKAILAVKNGQTKIIPEIWTNTYFEWLNNIKDWCISRQIWWGHQIPAWTCKNCLSINVSDETPDKCAFCGGNELIQEEDVLDTWFSSALWPFSTMGWPENTNLLKLFYPTSVLVTGFDILFFWVARMMMMGIHFMEDVPFKDVYVHALVRDEEGKKMSKSKGNVIDPLNVITTYGTDAFRFTLAAFAAQGRDIKLSESRIEGYRHFINKLWNATRFSLMHLGNTPFILKSEPVFLPDKWIISKLFTAITTVEDALNNYRFNDAASALYKFVWHEFCDWYLEAIKPVLYGKIGNDHREATLNVLSCVMANTIILLHPFIPFVTEEIWNKLPETEGSIMKASFPLKDGKEQFIKLSIEAEENMEFLTGIINGIRNIRGEMNIQPSLAVEVVICSDDKPKNDLIKQYESMVSDLARLKSLSIQGHGERPSSAASSIYKDAIIFVKLEGILEFDKEIQRLENNLQKVRSELLSLSKKLRNDGFRENAPKEVIQKVKERQEGLIEQEDKLLKNLDKIKEFASEANKE